VSSVQFCKRSLGNGLYGSTGNILTRLNYVQYIGRRWVDGCEGTVAGIPVTAVLI
jgi:hypothetical protein